MPARPQIETPKKKELSIQGVRALVVPSYLRPDESRTDAEILNWIEDIMPELSQTYKMLKRRNVSHDEIASDLKENVEKLEDIVVSLQDSGRETLVKDVEDTCQSIRVLLLTHIDQFEYFLIRLIRYLRDYPYLKKSGDYTLLCRSILAEIRSNEIDQMSLSEIQEMKSPEKWLDALTKISTQLVNGIKTLGTTTRQERQEVIEVAKIVVNHTGLRKVEDKRKKGRDWLKSLPALENQPVDIDGELDRYYGETTADSDSNGE